MSTDEGTKTVEQVEDGAKPEPELGDAGKAAIAAERKRASAAEKAVKELTDRLKEFEDRDKSEAEKLRDSLTAAETELSRFKEREQIAQWRQEVAAEHELSAEVAAALRGNSLEELTAHAELLKSLQPTGARGPRVPNEGKQPTGGIASNAQLFAELFSQ